MAAFSVSVAQKNGICRVQLRGKLDLGSSPKLRTSVDDIRGPIVIDCSDLLSIDTAGIAVLTDVNQNGGIVLLRHVSAKLWRVLHVSGMAFLIDPLEYWATPYRH